MKIRKYFIKVSSTFKAYPILLSDTFYMLVMVPILKYKNNITHRTYTYIQDDGKKQKEKKSAATAIFFEILFPSIFFFHSFYFT